MDVKEVRLELIEKIKSLETTNVSQIDAFFSRIQVQAVSKGFIMLTTETAFIKEWIETHYIPEIKEALKQLYGVDFEVLIEIDTTQVQDDQIIEVKPVNNVSSSPSASPAFPTESAINPGASSTISASGISSSNTTVASNNPISGNTVSVNTNTTNYSATSSSSKESEAALLRFETFVMGESNRMAYHMALEVAEKPGDPNLNPLFIWGRSGVGKTHLLCSIKNFINDQYTDFNVCYIDSMELVNRYGDAASEHSINKNSFKDFEKFFEQFDVLLIDDVQNLQGKRETVNALFRIINNNIRKGKQLVFAADRAPKNIDLDERYTTRFASGLVADIQPPDDETKRNIVKGYIKQYERDEGFSIEVSDIVLDYIVELSSSNIRELKSAILTIIFHMKLEGEKELTRKKVSQLLSNHFISGGKKKITVDIIQSSVEKFYKVSHSDLIGKSRARKITTPRQVAIYLCYQLTEDTGSAIAKEFKRDHTTAMHAKSVIEQQLHENHDLVEEIEAIKTLIKEEQF